MLSENHTFNERTYSGGYGKFIPWEDVGQDDSEYITEDGEITFQVILRPKSIDKGKPLALSKY